jgi:tRNA-(ms[2]io[6]A)-hydroxylase
MYAGLLASEARHYRTYTDLARDRFGVATTTKRLDELARHEAAVLTTLHPEPRMHA